MPNFKVGEDFIRIRSNLVPTNRKDGFIFPISEKRYKDLDEGVIQSFEVSPGYFVNYDNIIYWASKKDYAKIKGDKLKVEYHNKRVFAMFRNLFGIESFWVKGEKGWFDTSSAIEYFNFITKPMNPSRFVMVIDTYNNYLEKILTGEIRN